MRCLKCEKEQPDTAFGFKPTGERKKWCKPCCREGARLTALGESKERAGRDYLSRWINLRALGFKTYKEYLRSDLWKQVRAEVFAAKGRSCYLCGEPATELHHNRYHRNDLTGKKLKHIHPICRGCHEGIEFGPNGGKRELVFAKKNFGKIRNARKRAVKERGASQHRP